MVFRSILPASDEPPRDPTSVVLEGLLREAEGDEVTLDWIVANLRERSFGIVMLLIALVGLVPGIASIAGIVLALPAVQMVLARRAPVLPRMIATRRLSIRRLEWLVARLVPVLRFMERFVRPRWTTPFEATKRVIGVVIVLLSVSVLAPIPFSHVIPLMVVMLLAFAFLEEDGVLLVFAIFAALVSLGITTAAVWGSVEVGLLL